MLTTFVHRVNSENLRDVYRRNVLRYVDNIVATFMETLYHRKHVVTKCSSCKETMKRCQCLSQNEELDTDAKDKLTQSHLRSWFPFLFGFLSSFRSSSRLVVSSRALLGFLFVAWVPSLVIGFSLVGSYYILRLDPSHRARTMVYFIEHSEELMKYNWHQVSEEATRFVVYMTDSLT